MWVKLVTVFICKFPNWLRCPNPIYTSPFHPGFTSPDSVRCPQDISRSFWRLFSVLLTFPKFLATVELCALSCSEWPSLVFTTSSRAAKVTILWPLVVLTSRWLIWRRPYFGANSWPKVDPQTSKSSTRKLNKVSLYFHFNIFNEYFPNKSYQAS